MLESGNFGGLFMKMIHGILRDTDGCEYNVVCFIEGIIVACVSPDWKSDFMSALNRSRDNAKIYLGVWN